MTSASTSNLEIISEEGKAPKCRIASPESARNIASQILEGSKERDRLNAKIKGMIDGNPPYDAAKLKQAGQGDRTNVNFLEGKGALSAALVPYYDLFSGSKHYCNVTTTEGDVYEREEWSRILTEEFDEMLKSYPSFDFQMQRMLPDFVGFGKGFHMWRDEKDWRFRCVQQHRVKVPDNTPASVEELEILLIVDSETTEGLWKKIKDNKTAENAGWDVKQCLDAIRYTTNDADLTAEQDDYMEMQRKLRDKELTHGLRSVKIPVYHFYVKEYDGKVTHQIILVTPPAKESDKKERFLYRKTGRYEKFRNCIAAFFLEVMDGSWNGISGLGRDIYAPMELKNRLKCSAIDNAFLRAGLTLRPMTPAALNKTSLIHVGKVSIVPPDYEVLNSTIFADIDGAVTLDREMDMMLAANTGVYRQRMEKPTGNPRTAEEVRLQYQNSAVLGNSAVNRFYQQMDWFYTELYRRTLLSKDIDGEGGELAKEFFSRCKKRNVPEEAIKSVKTVRAARSMGNGSAMMKRDSVNGMSGLYPLLPEQGKQAWLEDAVASMTNQEMVDRYVPKPEQPNSIAEHEAMAMLENGVMKVGTPVVITGTQNNVVHAQVHMIVAAQAAQSLQQGASEDDVLAFLNIIGPHMAQHLERFSQAEFRKAEYKELKKRFDEIANITDYLMDRAMDRQQEAMLRQQQQVEANRVNAGIDPETQIEVARAKSDMGIKQAKAQQAIVQKAEKHNQNMQIQREKAAMERATAALERANANKTTPMGPK